VFIFAGLGLKMALVPLHLWLPDAYTHAPSSVNTLLAPIMTKVGAYAMMRMFLSVFPDGYLSDVIPVADALVVLGLVGVAFGAIAAISQQDIRRMLAYSSIGQLGLIAAAIGLATPLGLVAALLHIMNHAVMKGTLFISVASVRYRTGLSSVDGFTGLGRTMPWTMGAFTVAAISMVGIPPAAGFFSKWWVAQAGAEADQWAVVAVVVGSSLLTASYLFRVLERAYLRPAQPDPAAAAAAHSTDADSPANAQEGSGGKPPVATTTAAGVREAPVDMVFPAVLLALATIVLGLLNTTIVTNVLERGV
jgi:multicomponent Na+:H+ antiporter subunit D